MNIADALRALVDNCERHGDANAFMADARAALAAHDAAVTAGGWRSGVYAPDSMLPRVWDDTGRLVADAITLAHADRIAQCVNACAGIEDPARLVSAARLAVAAGDIASRVALRDALGVRS